MNIYPEEQINQYFTYIQEMKDAIDSISSGKSVFVPHLKYLACIGLIDTLAKCINNPNQKSNYKRFTGFVKAFCDWQDCTKISLPHLVRCLQLIPFPDFEAVRKFANSKLSTWQTLPRKDYQLDSDPTFEEIIKLWPRDKEHKEPLEKVSLESLSHLSLFWRFRNSIVHELHVPGYGDHGCVSKKPEYHHALIGASYDEAVESWELVYPVPFVMELLSNGIKNLKIHLSDNSLNPYEYYKFGSFWIDVFN